MRRHRGHDTAPGVRGRRSGVVERAATAGGAAAAAEAAGGGLPGAHAAGAGRVSGTEALLWRHRRLVHGGGRRRGTGDAVSAV